MREWVFHLVWIFLLCTLDECDLLHPGSKALCVRVLKSYVPTGKRVREKGDGRMKREVIATDNDSD